jgi:hypothetical protein
MTYQEKPSDSWRGMAVRAATVEEVVPVLPAGVYLASFEGIEQQSNDNGVFWLWHFKAQHGDETVEVTATTSPRITPKTKAARFLAGLGVRVDVGDEVDFDDLVPTPCNIVIEINDNGYSRITNIVPYTEPVKAKAK